MSRVLEWFGLQRIPHLVNAPTTMIDDSGRQYEKRWVMTENEFGEDTTFRRIYHPNDNPYDVRVSWNVFDRPQQDPKECTTIGWVISKGRVPKTVEDLGRRIIRAK
jgi:hypothetical protein